MSRTALLEAIRTFDLPRVREILRAEPARRDFRDDDGYNLLQLVSKRVTAGKPEQQRNQLKLAKWLVEDGFDPKALYWAPPEGEDDKGGNVSLAWFAVAKAQNTALARFFLERGADPGALFAAAWWGNAEIIPDLVKRGAKVNEVAGATPLHMAVDVVTRGTEGKPKLARERVRVLKELLRLGADPNIAAVDGTTPLHTALKKEYFEAFTILLRHGANPEVPGKDGRTVREIAARKRDKRYIDALIR